MERQKSKSIAIFTSFEDADRAEKAYYHSLSPEERMDIALELGATYREQHGEASSRLERVYRVAELEID